MCPSAGAEAMPPSPGFCFEATARRPRSRLGNRGKEMLRRQPEGRPHLGGVSVGQGKKTQEHASRACAFARRGPGSAQVDAGGKRHQDHRGQWPRSSRPDLGFRNLAYRMQKAARRIMSRSTSRPRPRSLPTGAPDADQRGRHSLHDHQGREHEQGPSVMMRRGERDKRRGDRDDDRGPRGDRNGGRSRDEFDA